MLGAEGEVAALLMVDQVEYQVWKWCERGDGGGGGRLMPQGVYPIDVRDRRSTGKPHVRGYEGVKEAWFPIGG